MELLSIKLQNRLPLLMVALFCASAAFGKDVPTLKAAFEKNLGSVNTPVVKLNASYLAALKKLGDKMQKNGDLEGMLLIREEIKGFETGPVAGVEKSPELAKTRKVYDSAKAKRLGEVEAELVKRANDYVANLQALVVAQTKAGKLEEAIAAKAEADRVKALVVNPTMLASILLKIDTSGATTKAAIGSPIETTGGGSSIANSSRFIPLAQRPSGTLHFKGVNIGANHGKKLMDQRTGIVDVRVAWNRWMALKKDGTVISTGYAQPADLRPAVGIAMGPHTDIVFHADGTVTSWGRAELGTPADVGPVRDFGVGEKAGIAALPDGTLKLWGTVYKDPNVIESIQSKIKDVAFVSAAADLSWAVTESGKIYRWRDKAFDPVVLGRASDIAQFEATFAGVVVLTAKGKLEGWNQWDGGLASKIPSNVTKAKKIKASWSSLVVQDEDGKWYGDGTEFPELLEVFETFDENVIDVSMGSWTTNGLVGWIVKDN